MKRESIYKRIGAFLLAFLMIPVLIGCKNQSSAAKTAEPALTVTPASQAESAVSSVPESEPGRQNGERFDEIIILEGMEETVHYEHVRSETVGIEMDYDYESFARHSEAGLERFISIWDNTENPENYLDVMFSAEDAESVAANVRESLSQMYDLLEGTRELDRAGSCLYIEASVLKDTNTMADQLQMVYIIPASDGCRIATMHVAAEAAEGFGRRFRYMLDTLAVIEQRA